MDLLSKISITCFFFSYLVAFVAELSQLFLRKNWQRIILICFTVAGIIAHTAFVVLRLTFSGGQQAAYGNWMIWCLMVGLFLAICYLYLTWRQPKADIGLFLLPMLLLFCVFGFWLEGSAGQFTQDESTTMLGRIHGYSLLLGTVAVFVGFVCGVMYLIQSARLKAKSISTRGLKLPSLEWLQIANERSLIVSSVMLAAGLLSGMLSNVINSAEHRIEWGHPVVWSSLFLFLWIVSATLFNWFYTPSRRGRKIAYLTVASFLFLVVVLVLALSLRHANDPAEDQYSQSGQRSQNENRIQQCDNRTQSSSTIMPSFAKEVA